MQCFFKDFLIAFHQADVFIQFTNFAVFYPDCWLDQSGWEGNFTHTLFSPSDENWRLMCQGLVTVALTVCWFGFIVFKLIFIASLDVQLGSLL